MNVTLHRSSHRIIKTALPIGFIRMYKAAAQTSYAGCVLQDPGNQTFKQRALVRAPKVIPLLRCESQLSISCVSTFGTRTWRIHPILGFSAIWTIPDGSSDETVQEINPAHCTSLDSLQRAYVHPADQMEYWFTVAVIPKVFKADMECVSQKRTQDQTLR